MNFNLLLVLVAISHLSTSQGYRILCLFPVPSNSHTTLGKGIVDALLKASHEVTWVTPRKAGQKPVANLTLIEVDTKSLSEVIGVTDETNSDLFYVQTFAKNVSAVTVQNQQLRDALVKEQFDAVVTEWFFSDTDAGYAAVQQVPWIVLGGVVMHAHLEYLVDEIHSIPTLPFILTNFPIPMNYWQRMVNTGIFLAAWAKDLSQMFISQFRYEEFFAPLAAARGVPLPPFRAAVHNISVVLLNSHPSIAPAQSLPPNVVDIAGYHIGDAAPLPEDLQDLMDSSSHGVVYFSMGSILKSSALPEQTKRDLIRILGELPYTVLWKFEEDIQGLPKNVHIRPWWPQASVLAHPKVKLFITHGGLLSTLEAVRYGVPLLAIPIFGDQPSNANRAVRAGYALRVTYSADMGDQLKSVLKEMLQNDSYYKQAKYLSKLFNMRPVEPSKLIPHYVELAIESKGAFHLRSRTLLYPWYQRWALDFIATLLLIILVLYKIARALINIFRKNDKNKPKFKRN